ncbi:hypothetical protein [Methanopyrus kandleri]
MTSGKAVRRRGTRDPGRPGSVPRSTSTGDKWAWSAYCSAGGAALIIKLGKEKVTLDVSVIEGDPEEVEGTRWFVIRDDDGDVVIVSVSKLFRILRERIEEKGIDIDSVHEETRREADEIAQKMYFEG